MNELKPAREHKKIYFNQYIPKSLETTDLDEEEIRILGYMTHRFVCGDGIEFNWLPMPRTLLRLLAGADQYKYMQSLLDKNIIELFVHESGATFSYDKGLCKRYRYAQPYRDELFNRKFFKIRSSSQRVNFDKKPCPVFVNNREDDSSELIPTDPLLELLVKNYDGVKLQDKWQDVLWPLEEKIDSIGDEVRERHFISDKAFAFQIGKGKLNLSKSSSGRLFHPTILMRNDLRQFITYNGITPIDIDVKAAHPNFLGKFASSDDQQRWIQECNTGNIYFRFFREGKLPNDKEEKDRVKKQFQQAISYAEQKSKDATEIVNYIKDEYPSIHTWLSQRWDICKLHGKHKNTPQFILQTIESTIFIEKTFTKLHGRFWMLPMHDGFLVEECNAEKLKKHLNRVALNELGFELKLTNK